MYVLHMYTLCIYMRVMYIHTHDIHIYICIYMRVHIYNIHDSHVRITHVYTTQKEVIHLKVLANTAHEEAEEVCCSVLQCVAVCCSVLLILLMGRLTRCAVVCCSVWQCVECVALCCSVLQCVANTAREEAEDVCCSVLQCVAV